MRTTSECLGLLRAYYNTKAAEYGIRKMALFGSVARNEQTEDSDVDIAYEGEPNMLLRCRMKQELEELFGLPVDLVRLRKSLVGTTFYNLVSKDFVYV